MIISDINTRLFLSVIGILLHRFGPSPIFSYAAAISSPLSRFGNIDLLLLNGFRFRRDACCDLMASYVL